MEQTPLCPFFSLRVPPKLQRSGEEAKGFQSFLPACLPACLPVLHRGSEHFTYESVCETKNSLTTELYEGITCCCLPHQQCEWIGVRRFIHGPVQKCAHVQRHSACRSLQRVSVTMHTHTYVRTYVRTYVCTLARTRVDNSKGLFEKP